MSAPIVIQDPFKENVCIVGMGQEGKTMLMAYLLKVNRNPYVLFDTIGVYKRAGFEPLRPETQRVVTPRNARERKPLFLQTCREAWAQGNLIFAVDEMSMHCSKHQMPDELDTVINQGGNHNIAYWFTTRRVAQIHNDILASAHHHCIFRTYLPQDLVWYGAVVPKDIIEMSKDLPKYHFLYYPLGGQPKKLKPCPKVM